jgi:hypothetical protein
MMGDADFSTLVCSESWQVIADHLRTTYGGLP